MELNRIETRVVILGNIYLPVLNIPELKIHPEFVILRHTYYFDIAAMTICPYYSLCYL